MASATPVPNGKVSAPELFVEGTLGKSVPSADWRIKIMELASAFGFDGASYFLFTDDVERRPVNHWSTADKNWLHVYQRNSLHLDDPRLEHRSGNAAPLVWGTLDTATGPDDGIRRFGIGRFVRGGVVLSLSSESAGRAVMCWDLAHDRSMEQQHSILQTLDKLALVSAVLIELIWSRPHIRNEAFANDIRLTARESQCLAMAANGMTSADIGVKLGIAQRTANFHFGNIIAKLHALNRGEAIARAVALGLYNPPERTWARRERAR